MSDRHADRYKFNDLTESQQSVIVFGRWTLTSKFPQPNKRTVKKLIERGMVIPHDVEVHGALGAMTVTEYQVPIDVHAIFCRWSSYKFSGRLITEEPARVGWEE